MKNSIRRSIFGTEEWCGKLVGISLAFLHTPVAYVFLCRLFWLFPDRIFLLLYPFLFETGHILFKYLPRAYFVSRRISNGSLMRLDISEKTQRNIFIHRCYEMNIARFFLATLKEGDVVIDVGANVGYFTLLSAKIVGDTGAVLAFEPELNNFKHLTEHIHKNNMLSSVRCFNYALGAEEDTVILHINPLNHGGNSLHAFSVYKSGSELHSVEEMTQRYTKEELFQKTRVRALSNVLREEKIKQVAILKIDVEGFEAQVFDGMKEVLAKGIIKNIVCELGNKETRKSVISILKQYGYHVFSIDASGFPIEVETGRDLLFTFGKIIS